MSLRLLLGRAGVGKTYRCLEEMAAALRSSAFGPPLILLVPEQATFQMEQALIEHGIQGSARARILSFKRLAHLIFSEVGGVSRPRLAEVGRKMLLRALVHRRRDELELFAHSAGQAGFTERLAQTFSEFRVHGYGPDDVAQMAANPDLSPVLRKKLSDLALLYADFTAYIADRYADPDSFLGEAAQALGESRLLENAQVWVDGFAGFTPQEFRMLQAIFATAARVHVSLCLDPEQFAECMRSGEPPAEFSLFRLPMETARELMALCRQIDVEIEEPHFLTAHPEGRFRTWVLAHLERAWDKPQAPPFDGETDPLIVQSAEDRTAEVEAVAAEIHRLVREEGYRFKEISVVVRNLDTYAPHIAAVFSKFGVPYFIDQRRPMLFHPLVQGLSAALEAIASRWQSEPVLRFLKTDLAQVTRDEVDRLENHVLEHGITGRAWVDERPWRFGRRLLRDDEEEATGEANSEARNIDQIRRSALRELMELESTVGRGHTFTPKEAAEALWRFLESLRADERLTEWIDEADAADDPELSSLHVQVWNALIDLIEQMANVLPQEPIDLQELIAMIEEGVQGLRLGLIPPKLDQVLVGAIDRSRQPNVRAVFVLGVVDREFPAVPQEDAVITDAEREALTASGFALGETSRTRMEREHFFGYIAITRASERLVLSYPRSDGAGKALLPSPIIDRVRRLVPAVDLRAVGRMSEGGLWRAVTPEQAAGYLVRALRTKPDDERSLDAYEWFVTHPVYAKAVRPTLRSLAYSNAVRPLEPELARELYGAPFVTSVSRLERFASCPFQHFAVYGLRLKERSILRLDPSRLGVLTHAVLKRYVDRVMEEGRNWDTFSDEEALRIVDELTEAAAEEFAGEVLLSSARQRYLIDLTRRTLHTAVRLINEHARAGTFRPVATETGFGRPGDPIKGWRLELSDGGTVQVVGVIDRMDLSTIDGVPYVRVIDYKSYNRKIVWSDILQGLELQLLVYLGVAVESQGWAPAGAFYVPVRDPLIETEVDVDEEALWELRKKELKPQGILVSDDEGKVALEMDGSVTPGRSSTLLPFGIKKDNNLTANSSAAPQHDLELLIERVRALVTELAEAIVRGEHGVQPFRRKNRNRACDFCPYHAVCRFDVLVDGNEYRYLESYKQSELWKRLREVEQEGTPSTAS